MVVVVVVVCVRGGGGDDGAGGAGVIVHYSSLWNYRFMLRVQSVYAVGLAGIFISLEAYGQTVRTCVGIAMLMRCDCWVVLVRLVESI